VSGHGEKRSRKTEQLISALMSHPTVAAAASAAGISEATAWRWMKQPSFVDAYRGIRREAMRQATAQLQQSATEAVATLRRIQAHAESEQARVSAARCLLENAFRAVELEEIEHRLAALEHQAENNEG